MVPLWSELKSYVRNWRRSDTAVDVTDALSELTTFKSAPNVALPRSRPCHPKMSACVSDARKSPSVEEGAG